MKPDFHTKICDDWSLEVLNGLEIDEKQRAWVEIDASSIKQNSEILKNRISENCLLMAVVKADGYGHGAVTVANSALKGGADCLGVATLKEGIELRQSGFKCSILVLGNLIKKKDLRTCFELDLTPTLSSFREAIICQDIASEKDSSANFNIHLKVDTGMTRLGCSFEEAERIINKILELKNVALAGIYSHLAMADALPESYASRVTELQKYRFDQLIKSCPKNESPVCFHLANSAGMLQSVNMHYDMVRVGIALYGYSPVFDLEEDLGLKPALSLKARVTLVREVPAGTGVGYGHSYRTHRKSLLAVVAIGYADGVSRALSGKISALFEGQLFPQVGSIAMDQMVFDITNNTNIKVGSVMTLLGGDEEMSISPKDWSERIGSIPWEIMCSFKNRLPRVVV